jgi:hypothetical protein
MNLLIFPTWKFALRQGTPELISNETFNWFNPKINGLIQGY